MVTKKSRQFTLRVPEDTWTLLMLMAQARRCAVNTVVNEILEQSMRDPYATCETPSSSTESAEA